jgi:8-oxo-dGTP diphosphatase
MVNFFYKSKKLRVRVAALIRNESGEILLIKQRKKKKDYWLLPGGGIEFGESAIDALGRELKEELNIEIENPVFLLLNENIDPKGQRHLIQLIFGGEIKSGMEPTIPKKEQQILEYKYFAISELESLEIRPDIKEYLTINTDWKPSAYIKSKWINE